MTKLLRWISQSVFRIAVEPGAPESIDHVDGAGLADNYFWASASMRLDETALAGFCETLPARYDGSAKEPRTCPWTTGLPSSPHQSCCC